MSLSPDSDMPDASRVFSTFTNPSETQSTVIIGAGIIGCATAYYLASSGNTKPDTIHLVEASPELFASASGKAGGFCAPDWFAPPAASLGTLSFRLHKELADQHNGPKNWGYTRSTATQFTQSRKKRDKNAEWLGRGESRAQVAAVESPQENGVGPTWLTKQEGDEIASVSDDGGVAQLDPLRLCQFLLKQCIMKGVRLHHPAKPVRISRDEHGEMSAIRIQHRSGADHKIPCTRLLITAGAWTQSVFNTLFPEARIEIPVSKLAGHSLAVRSPRWTEEMQAKGCHAIFMSMRDGLSPEAFSRVGGEIWIGGVNDAAIDLPDEATDAKPDQKSMDRLVDVAKQLLGKEGEDNLEVVREGVCFRPVTDWGQPILARVPDEELGGMETRMQPDGGVFVAAGHGPWGISLGLGTGKVMAEMLEGGSLSAAVGGLGMRRCEVVRGVCEDDLGRRRLSFGGAL